MKISFVVINPDYFISHRLDLAKNLAKLHDVHLITNLASASESKIQEITDLGISVHHLSNRAGSFDIAGYLKYIYNLKNLIQLQKFDYVFYVTLEMSTLGALINNFLKIKKSYFLITGIGPFFYSKKLKYKLYRFIQKIIFILLRFKNNYLFIFQNDDDQEIFINKKLCRYGMSTIIQGNGVDTSYFKYLKREVASKITFLFASKLIYSKGIIEFMNASKKIAEKFQGIKFYVAGNYDPYNPDTISAKDFENIKTSDYIEYKGFIETKKMRDCLYESSVLVLPSYGEGLPKVALEASATGLPLILSNVSGCRDCLIEGKNGLLVEAKNSHAIEIAMEKFINQKELINIYGKFSSEFVNTKFSLRIISQKFLDLLED